MIEEFEAATLTWADMRSARFQDVVPLYFSGRIDNPEVFDQPVDRIDRDAVLRGIVSLYIKHGVQCADMLLGDFVFALWDPGLNAVVCARDYIGCECAYYTVGQDRFIIAPTIELALEALGLPVATDEPFAATYLTRFFNHPERTMAKGVHKIPPGHVVKIGPDRISRTRYWHPGKVAPTDYSDPAAAHERFRELLDRAVRDRLPADGKIGAHITGGLDSSAVSMVLSGLLQAEGRPPPVAFSWQAAPDQKVPDGDQTFRELSPLEYEAPEAVCAMVGARLLHCPTRVDDILHIWRRDERTHPTGGNTYSEWPVICEAARHGVCNIFSGFGGDEAASYAGGGYTQNLALTGRWLRLFWFARKVGRSPLRVLAGNLYHGLIHLLMPEWILSQFSRETKLGVPAWKAMVRILLRRSHGPYLLNRREATACLTMFPYASDEAIRRIKPLPRWKMPRLTSVRRAMADVLEYGHITQRTESWAQDGRIHGIRYLYPLLDKRIVEFALGLPAHAFVDGKSRRHFFRKAIAPLVPEQLLRETKLQELARADWALPQFKTALQQFADDLRAGDVPSHNLHLVDQERLLQSLTGTALEERTGIARLLFAVQLIGMKSK